MVNVPVMFKKPPILRYEILVLLPYYVIKL